MGNSPLLSLPKHRKLCQLTQTRALTRVLFPLPFLKTPASPHPISSVVSGPPGGKQEAGAGQGPGEERSARGAHAPPAVPGFLHPLLMLFRFGGRLRQPCEAQGSPFWGVESSGVISRPATHSAPGGVAAAATAGSAGGCSLGVGADNALKSPDPTAKVPFVHEADGFV